MARRVRQHSPGPGPQRKDGSLWTPTFYARITPKVAPTDEMLETHYAALERAACPFCYEGWVYMGSMGRW